MSETGIVSPDITVMVVDDSIFFRTSIEKIIQTIPGMRLIESARNGQDALQKLQWVKPDVILLDFFMPKMNGIETLKEIMRRDPIPTIIVTAADRSEYAEMYFEALRIGAFDIITKPSGGDALRFDLIRDVLENRIRYAVKAKVPQVVPVQPPVVKREFGFRTKARFTHDVQKEAGILVIVGASTGGPKALFEVFSHIHYYPEVSICVIQHMPENFTKSLASRIDSLSEYHAKEADNMESLKTGWIYVAPGDFHMELVENDGRYLLETNQNERVHGCRPSVDVFMKSAIRNFGARRIIGVLLTGMGDDGAAGMLLIRESGGSTIVQNRETAEIWGMPKKAVELGAAEYILPLEVIGDKINSLIYT